MPEVVTGVLEWLLVYGTLWGVGIAFIWSGLEALDRESWAIGLASIVLGILTIVYRHDIRRFVDEIARALLDPAS